MQRIIRNTLAVLFASALSLTTFAQNAQFQGRVTDPSQAVVAGAEVRIFNQATGVERKVKTNHDGLYIAPFVSPGTYQIYVQAPGFSTVSSNPLVLTVGQTLVFDVQLKVGTASQEVTVDSGSQMLNTTDATVSTVVDRKFVENMPLNGRSLQSLISLAPGVVQTPIPYGSNPGNSGEFSVNGQRTESNYYTVDGVSANVGVGDNGTWSAGASGSTPSQTALGTTQSLASIDALQEFRLNTSTYSAEYGRTPGGQISFQTRSGTDQLHGTVFDYLRNDTLDANNWFNDHTVPITRKTAERQNDFGGTVGGPIFIPHLYDGHRHSFFFYSYEGLRLTVPTPATTTEVPSVSLRQSTASGLQAFVNAFPVPPPSGSDVPGATGLSYFTGAYSLPSNLDTHSIRLDHSFNSQTQIFGRYSNSTSSSESRTTGNLAQLSDTAFVARTVTAGMTHAFGGQAYNDARFNYSWTSNRTNGSIDSFGGATPSTLENFLPKTTTPYTQFAAFIFWGTDPGIDLVDFNEMQTQLNLVDSQQFTLGRHSLKCGVDYRHLVSTVFSNQFVATLIYSTPQQLQNNSAGTASITTSGAVPPEPIYNQISSFCQDEWKATPSTTISVGLRWDVNPPPTNGNGRIPPVLNQINNLATAQLAPDGTPEWNTDYAGLAPRFGLATQLHKAPGKETVLRLGVGNFLDTGTTLGSIGFKYLGFASKQSYSGLSFPFADSVYSLPAPSTAAPYNQSVVGYDRNLKLPYTLQWNVSLEQALGSSRSFTLGYIGSAGRRLLTGTFNNPKTINTAFSAGNGAYIVTNGAWSNYHSLQAKFIQDLSHGLQILASMTWSHSIDNRSSSFINYQPLLKANSDFDIRENFQAAVTYNAPSPKEHALLRSVAGGWAVDMRVFARTAAPVDIYGSSYIAADGTQQYARPNVLAGVPLYVYGAKDVIPGGKKFNFAAFQAVTGTQGDAPRNFLSGFGATEVDSAIRRDLHVGDDLHIQFRAEAFNIFNHSNFGAIYNTMTAGSSQFGMAYNTLNVALKNQSSLYEQGGPRSLQLALKLLF